MRFHPDVRGIAGGTGGAATGGANAGGSSGAGGIGGSSTGGSSGAGGNAATGGSAGVDGGAGSGGTAGTDGGAGASGAGGTGGTGGCTKASDCTNPDAAHCTVSCVSQACVVAAADKDGDGHGAKQCAAAPGDDCDDGHKTVYPGAPEIYDGLDNNCNGKADLEDGLTLSGTNKVFATSSGDAEFPEVAWSPTASMYGVAWVDTRGASPQVYFARMNQAGAKVGSDTPIATGRRGSTASASRGGTTLSASSGRRTRPRTGSASCG